MKKYFQLFNILIFTFFFAFAIKVNAQGMQDPSALMVHTTTDTMVLDGQLNESDWSADLPQLMFKIGGTPAGNNFTPTGFAIVKPEYKDTSTCFVKFLKKGSYLYIGLKSDDKYVTRFGDSWEGDGLFMKIEDGTGELKEYKLYFNGTGTDPDMVFETNGPAGSEGVGYKMPGTIVHDSTNVDSGYTAELKLDLTSLGLDSSSAIHVLINIFDPDNYSDSTTAWGPNGNYAKQWWGSEWGPETRTLLLDSTNIDPMSLPVYRVSDSITIDGMLDEADWSEDVPRLKFKMAGVPSNNVYMPTGYAVVKPPYNDVSTCEVRFLHDDSNLYIALKSNDQSVCKFGDSWEGDGLFMKIADNNGDQKEYKLYFNATGTDPDIVFETNAPAGSEGAGYKMPGTVVNDTSGVDSGYTAELRIDLNSLGLTNPSSVQVLINIFDPDGYSDGDPAWGEVGSYGKQWWGSEWGPDTRTLTLEDKLVDVKSDLSKIPNSFSLQQNYPNPFNPTTTVNFNLPVRSDVRLEVYNLLGQKVLTLLNQKLSVGNHSVNVNAASLSSGVYFYRIDAQGIDGSHFVKSKKMVLLK